MRYLALLLVLSVLAVCFGFKALTIVVCALLFGPFALLLGIVLAGVIVVGTLVGLIAIDEWRHERRRKRAASPKK